MIVDTVMWSCSQIVYGTVIFFNLNIQLVSAILQALQFVFHQLLSLFYLIGIAIASILESCAVGAISVVDALMSVTDGALFSLHYANDGLQYICSWILYILPNTFKGLCAFAMWLKQSMMFLISNIMPVIEQAGLFIVTFLKALISYSAHFTVVVAMSIMTLFTLLIHGLYKLFALIVYTVYSALNETYQFFIGNTKPYETDEIPWSSKTDEADTLRNRIQDHLNIKPPPNTVYESFHESLSLFVFQVFDALSYLALCVAVVCVVIACLTLLYCLYSNCMSSVNALVTLFHRSIFRSERSIIIDTPADNIPGHHAVPVTGGAAIGRHRHLRNDFLDDVSDAESEDSVHLPAPPTPIPINDDDVAGPSGAVVRRRPQRTKSRTANLLSSVRSESDNSSSVADEKLARDLCRQLEEERDRQLCVVCQDNEKHILIFPCKHLCICIDCVEEIASSRVDRRKCPLCRRQISSYLEVYA